jgi:nucleoside-diphosphate-sugar epimerase
MRDIVEAITSALGKTVPSWHIPAFLVLNLVNILKLLSLNNVRIVAIYNNLRKWLADDYYDINKFKRDFNFQAEISCKEGIKKEASWYKRAFPREERQSEKNKYFSR